MLRVAFDNGWINSDGEQRARGQNLRDAYAHALFRAMGQVSPRARPVHCFVDGRYWGLYHLTKRPDSRFQANYLGCRRGDYQSLNAGVVTGRAQPGDAAASARWGALQAAWPGQDFSAVGAYADFLATFERDAFIDFVLLNAFLGNGGLEFFAGDDWTGHDNYYAGSKNTPGGRFRFFPWDSEETLVDPAADVFVGADRSRLLEALAANADFRIAFADRVQRHLVDGGALTADRAAALYAGLAAEIAPAVPLEAARWGAAQRPGEPYTAADWTAERDRLLGAYFPARPAVVLEQLAALGFFPDVAAPVFGQDGGRLAAGEALTIEAGGGTVFYAYAPADPRAPGGAVDPRAVAVEGGGAILDRDGLVRARVRLDGVWSPLAEAYFEVGPEPASRRNIALTEVMYRPSAATGAEAAPGRGRSDFEFIELKNVGDRAVDIGNLRLVDGVGLDFEQAVAGGGAGSPVLEPGEYVVVVRDVDAFRARYGEGPRVFAAWADGKLSNEGETLELFAEGSGTVQELRYRPGAPWPVLAETHGYSLVPAGDETARGNAPQFWRNSARPGGSPGGADPPAPAGVFINEIVVTPGDGLGAAVEVYNPGTEAIEIGGWSIGEDTMLELNASVPEGARVPAGGFVVLALDGAGGGGEGGDILVPGLTFLRGGGFLFLVSVDLAGTPTGFADAIRYYAADPGTSQGVHVDSLGRRRLATLAAPTLGSFNAPPVVGPLVINEIMYNPTDEAAEYIELRNISDQPLSLGSPGSGGSYRLFIPDARPSNFDPDFFFREMDLFGIELDPGELLVISPYDSGYTRQVHRIPESVDVIGGGVAEIWDFLSNRSATLQIQRVVREGGESFPRLVDQVQYGDRPPWPGSADGLGRSLERIDPTAFGDDPANWEASCVNGSPGLLHDPTYERWVASVFPAGFRDDAS